MKRLANGIVFIRADAASAWGGVKHHIMVTRCDESCRWDLSHLGRLERGRADPLCHLELVCLHLGRAHPARGGRAHAPLGRKSGLGVVGAKAGPVGC